MDSITALHAAVRQYCIDKVASLHQRYSHLVQNGKAEVRCQGSGWSYTAEALDTFPRYQVLDAILCGVEGLLPNDFKSLPEARGILELAGTARSDLTNCRETLAIAASEDERRQFALFVRTLDESRFPLEIRLPFRRTLGLAENKTLQLGLNQRWGNWYGGCVDHNEPDPDVVTLHVEAMKEPQSYEHLQAVLRERGISRLFELREYGHGFEIETALANFTYNGAEGFWTSGDFSWLVYASHESSITFGGIWLVEKMGTSLPEFEEYVYKGWDLAAYR